MLQHRGIGEGRSYRLRAVAGGDRPGARLDHGRFVVCVPSTVPEVRRPGAVRRALVDWYRQHAVERLRERVALWSPKVRVNVAEVLVREQRQRWASCDPAGRLRFNWRIVQAPMSLVDYVVAHELIHRVHKDHTRQFWATLGRVMPDYETRKERLRERGPGMVW
jgi:predicted metal-dependent hydrolase